MASVHRHSSGRSPYWFASYLGEDGKFKLRSTRQTDRNKAMSVALEFERGARLARAGELTEAQARNVLSDILERTTGDTIRAIAAKDFFEDWLTAKEANTSAGTAQRYRATVALFLKSLGVKAGRTLGSVATKDVQRFLNQRRTNGAASKTVSTDLKSLSAAFNRAFREGIIPANPCLAVEIAAVVSEERDVFTAQQVGLLVNAADGDWKTLVLIGYFTGARLRDCATMRWAGVNLAAGTLEYTPAKTRAKGKVIVPIHPELERHLMTLAGDEPEEFLCPSLAGRYAGGMGGLSYGFKRVMEAAGIDSGETAGQGKRRFSRLTFHSLRHSFNSALANAGVPQELRMKLTGHSTVAVNTGYTHHELATLKGALGKLPALT
jgi:integrase